MDRLQPGYLEGLLTALAVSVVAGLIVAWMLKAFRASPRLTYEIVAVFDLEGKLPIFSQFEQDGKGKDFSAEEYKKRLAELSSCRYFYLVRILNRGNRPAENVRVLLSGKPYHVDTYEKSGLSLSEFKDGIYELKLRSIAQNGYATVGFFLTIYARIPLKWNMTAFRSKERTQ